MSRLSLPKGYLVGCICYVSIAVLAAIVPGLGKLTLAQTLSFAGIALALFVGMIRSLIP